MFHQFLHFQKAAEKSGGKSGRGRRLEVSVSRPKERDPRQKRKLIRGRRRSVLAHARFVIGLDLSQFSFLIGRQNLHYFRLDALVFNLQLDHGLRVLRGEGSHFG
jgi:hypothetical protein